MMNQLLFSLSLTLLFHFNFSTTLAQSPAASPTAPLVPTVVSPIASIVPTVVSPTVSIVPTAASPPAPLVSIATSPVVPPVSIATSPVVPPVSAAVSPAPTASPNIIKILEKAGHYTLFVRLLKNTHVGDQINSQLKNSNNGLTVFAPSDSAFSSLKLGTVNSLSDEQQAKLVQSHFVPIFIPTTLFQTVTNPLRTLAGDTRPGQFPLNVTISGNQVNVSIGVMNTDVSDSIYTDSQTAVYQVNKVLLPWKIFGTPVPTTTPEPAPAPLTLTKKKIPSATIIPSTTSDSDASSAVSITMHGMVVTIGVGVVASFLL